MAGVLGFEPRLKVLETPVARERRVRPLIKIILAGVLGFEPRLKVLETLVLAIDTTPPSKLF